MKLVSTVDELNWLPVGKSVIFMPFCHTAALWPNRWLSTSTESGCYCYSVFRIVLNNSDIISQWMQTLWSLWLYALFMVLGTMCSAYRTHEHFIVIKYIKWDSIFLRLVQSLSEMKTMLKHNTRPGYVRASFRFYGFFIQIQGMF